MRWARPAPRWCSAPPSDGSAGSLGAPWGRPGLLALAAVATLYALGTITGCGCPCRSSAGRCRTGGGRSSVARSPPCLYGAGLGIGFLTYLSAGTLVVVAFAALASGSPGIGALVVAPFGLVRGLSAIVAWRSITQEQSRALVDRIASTPDVTRRVINGVVLLTIAVVALAASFHTAAGSWSSFAAALLAAAFTWAAASKIAKPARWRRALTSYRLPPALERVAVWAVPASEALVPLLVVAGLSRVAAIWSVALLTVFTVTLVASPRRMDGRIPCGCFGARGVDRALGPRSRGTRCCLPSPCSW